MNKITACCVWFSLLLLTACSSQRTPTSSTTSSLLTKSADNYIGCDATVAEIKTAMLSLVNTVRAHARACGAERYTAAPPLRWNRLLMHAASSHSRDMARHDFFHHTGSNGQSASERVSEAGYSWIRVGENLAGGQANTQLAVEAWIDSPGHCGILMNSAFKEFGVSCVSNKQSELGTYWTAVFGSRRQPTN